MTFSYSDYHFYCMVIPLITLFLTGAIFAGGAYKAVKDIARKGATVEKVLTLLMCLLIGGFFYQAGWRPFVEWRLIYAPGKAR